MEQYNCLGSIGLLSMYIEKARDYTSVTGELENMAYRYSFLSQRMRQYCILTLTVIMCYVVKILARPPTLLRTIWEKVDGNKNTHNHSMHTIFMKVLLI